MASKPAKRLTDDQKLASGELYSAGTGTIHGFAAIYDVAISTVKDALDELGIEHGRHLNSHKQRNISGEMPVVQIVRALTQRSEQTAVYDQMYAAQID